MRRFLVALPLVLSLVACNSTRDLEGPTDPLGDFTLGHVGVVAPNLQKLLVSRDATQDEWIEAMTDSLKTRFGRFDGDKFYHLGISVEAFSLPPPIIPGKSAVAMNVTVWDDSVQAKLNEEPKQIQVIKVFESRISKNRDQQLKGLADEAARLIEVWMREMQESDGWFGGTEANVGVVAPVAPQPAEAAPDQRTGVQVPEDVVAITNSAAAQPATSP
ncbi:hypothetical protein MWU54_12250 [Marivita sp. S6314]|uniref:hypothetical protein n=1 Tax=Marivita sp. S6314 TaxID=2926406 RepID=UPI001FF571C1|nr:hypothetical protein [Marivita sp. S6314]MCK0150801.1 hypothetical protein [Marivita sp. S6314]